MSRAYEISNPSSANSLFTAPAPESGPINVSATVDRDSSDESPLTVKLLQGSVVLGAENLTTPAGPGIVNFTFDASVLGDACEFNPSVVLEPCEECLEPQQPIEVPCCPNGIPRTITGELFLGDRSWGDWFPDGCIDEEGWAEISPFTLTYDDLLGRWVSPIYSTCFYDGTMRMQFWLRCLWSGSNYYLGFTFDNPDDQDYNPYTVGVNPADPSIYSDFSCSPFYWEYGVDGGFPAFRYVCTDTSDESWTTYSCSIRFRLTE